MQCDVNNIPRLLTVFLPRPFSVSQNTRVWIPSEFCRNFRTLRETQRVIEVAALSSSWCPFRFYKWKWTGSLWDGPWQLRLFWGHRLSGAIEVTKLPNVTIWKAHKHAICPCFCSSLLFCKQNVFIVNRQPLLARSYWISGWMPAKPGQQWAAHWHSPSLPAIQCAHLYWLCLFSHLNTFIESM